jgi:hypothetical protein
MAVYAFLVQSCIPEVGLTQWSNWTGWTDWTQCSQFHLFIVRFLPVEQQPLEMLLGFEIATWQ